MTVNLLALAFFPKNHNFFSKNTFVLFIETSFWLFWEVLLFQLHPPIKSLFSTISTKSFFSKNPYNLFNFYKFEKFWEVLFFQSRFTASLLVSAIFFKRNQFFFRKTHHIFPSKNINFEGFQNFYYFSQILLDLCYIYSFLLSKTVIFEESIDFFAAKNLNF